MNFFIRMFNSINVRLQVATLFLSAVGLYFGYTSYAHVYTEFGAEASQSFYADFKVQIFVALIANALVAFGILQTITRPIDQLTQCMDALVKGNLDIEVPGQASKNQIGSMARRVQHFKNSAIEKREMEAQQAQNAIKAEEDKRRMMNNLAADFENHVGLVMTALRNSSAKLELTAKDLGGIVDDTNSRVQDVSSATDKAANNVDTVAAAAGQLAHAIEQVSALVHQSSTITVSAVEQMTAANAQVEKLTQSMAQIGDVTNLIRDIAEQTNLLALNATIEAARAGEAGKGFAVVAGEVKNLASQTASATERITKNVSEIRAEAVEVLNAIRNAASTVNKIREISGSIATCVEQERAATFDINQSVREASSQTNMVSTSIAGVADAAHHTDKSARALNESVTALTQNTRELDDKVVAFLKTVRAA